uniref:Uncharacterized protein n=1 Tax=Anopheles atroparvus TaxID=41427 RepID=A0A182IWQ6_ANOAO
MQAVAANGPPARTIRSAPVVVGQPAGNGEALAASAAMGKMTTVTNLRSVRGEFCRQKGGVVETESELGRLSFRRRFGPCAVLESGKGLWPWTRLSSPQTRQPEPRRTRSYTILMFDRKKSKEQETRKKMMMQRAMQKTPDATGGVRRTERSAKFSKSQTQPQRLLGLGRRGLRGALMLLLLLLLLLCARGVAQKPISERKRKGTGR